ncbi:hypothetical protein CFC21_043977 [Triticum aestivum]|uniref:F-box protein AT5G49610-like beta-propeller domain-containing protein n=2 Tax=Triticum aestivum TaxID=4565 RepID=A0A077S7D7_WHEAT|nr:uncharacterized protein LOC123066429 [Triticum aestivum]KAF7032844.1 hypothetical protein CFC21_043977 [Triticum aestivum]CDM86178.1 unnamed protein product [Triticum aestivum]CDM86183.1 unnamed protein product [Triticum aestivum]
MDGDRRLPAAAALASAAAVLGDDNLLPEILIRLGFPTCLIHAALISKRWLHHASDPAFLRRFRERNPPRLLGVCVGYPGRYRFVPLPQQPPELAAPIRRAISSCDAAFARGCPRIKHCRNGRLIIEVFHAGRFDHPLVVPLLTGESAAVLPQIRPHRDRWVQGTQTGFTEMFLPEDGGRDGITLVNLWKDWPKVYAEVCILGSGRSGVPARGSTEIELPDDIVFHEMLPPIHGKVFMVTNLGYTLGLDLATRSLFTLELPVGVRGNYMLSCAEDSGLYLVSADGFQLSVWLHRMSGDDNGAGWLLVDTFCVGVGQACTPRAEDSWVPHDVCLDVVAVGDDADFVFLDHPASGALFYVHLRSRVVEKVYQRGADECGYKRTAAGHVRVSPVMMIWPPIFPARNVKREE